ncbi:MAG TPA: polysaccharide biosynthesis tyrosine autokinase, partial [Opitutales bacterium]|nr:polysaccharide biosynthesis tyrosine autokinase [Opitutales bacterium]
LKEQQTRTQSEFDDAVNSAAEKVHTDYLAAMAKFNSADAEVKSIQEEIRNLNLVQSKYDNLANEKDAAETMLKDMQRNVEQQTMKVLDNSESYLPVDSAKGSVTQIWPKTPYLVLGGIVIGLMGGIGMAFLVAFLDDRIKSAFDIESYVGLPLIGILPRIAHLNASEKAQAVASNADRRITEAFRSIYSSLKLNEASKNARVILVTSTVPSEGKSFMTTNLALTYAMHAERVLLIDCDLRMPNVAKSLGREVNDVGLITHLREGRPFEECIVKDFYPGLDVMPTGGRTNNPTQIFNSREFADFITRMRQQYDRVFIDSPPLGAVSDALNLLPNVDGVLYVIKFNTVKRKVAKINLSRLMQGNVPVYGAILNQISLTSASYYYTHYYDKSYRNYYMHEDERQAAEGEAAPAGQAENQAPPSEQSQS